MKKELKGSLVFDTGILLSLIAGKYKEIFDKIENDEIKPIINKVSLIETYYVLCRKIGEEKAKEVIDHLIDSHYFNVVEINEKIIEEAGKCKCKYSISLADCITIATAKVKGVKALFREEEELKDLNVPEVILIGK